MLVRKKKQASERAPRLEYNRPSSYHYSAKRSRSDKLFDRGETLQQVTKKARHIPTYLALMLVLASFGYLLSLSTSPLITVEGSQELLRDRDSIQPKANELIGKSLFNHSKLTFKKDDVSSELQKSFPEFASVSITTPIFRHRPHVDIKLAKPAVLLSADNHIYILDESGRALFDTVTDKPSFDTSGLPLVQDQSSKKVEIGKVTLSSGTITYISEVLKQTQQKNLQIESLLLVNGGGELDVRFHGLSYFVKMNLFEDARKSTGTFIATKEKLDSDNAKPNEYIDVRIPTRAYVK